VNYKIWLVYGNNGIFNFAGETMWEEDEKQVTKTIHPKNLATTKTGSESGQCGHGKGTNYKKV